MSFFRKPTGGTGDVASPGFQPPKVGAQRGDRTLGQRIERGEVPYHRLEGIKPTAQVERVPRGCLLKIGGGFFDLEGYWCVPLADHRVKVTRGAPRKVMRLLKPEQKRELERVRLNARRRGLR